MMDCWYAWIQIVKSTILGVKTKPAGAAAAAHRNVKVIGRKLSFASGVGAQVLAENQLEDVSRRVKLNRIMTLARLLQSHGPEIVGGKFGFFNTQGHAIVISGCNTDTGIVDVYDPAWGHGRETKSWAYIVRNCWKMIGDDDAPAYGTFIANETTCSILPAASGDEFRAGYLMEKGGPKAAPLTTHNSTTPSRRPSSSSPAAPSELPCGSA